MLLERDERGVLDDPEPASDVRDENRAVEVDGEAIERRRQLAVPARRWPRCGCANSGSRGHPCVQDSPSPSRRGRRGPRAAGAAADLARVAATMPPSGDVIASRPPTAGRPHPEVVLGRRARVRRRREPVHGDGHHRDEEDAPDHDDPGAIEYLVAASTRRWRQRLRRSIRSPRATRTSSGCRRQWRSGRRCRGGTTAGRRDRCRGG